jgi:hypothetical protein
MSSEPRIVGLRPWLPWPLCDWPWWTEPVRAERLAAFRIGVALMLLVDIFTFYLPHANVFFGRDSLGSPDVFAPSATSLHWSVLRGVESPAAVAAVMVIWALSAVFLLLGVWTRLSAAVAWLLSVSVIGINAYVHNSGDNVRTIELFYLMVSPCAAIWCLGKRQTGSPSGARNCGSAPGPVYIHPWPLRLLLVQLIIMYFFNGVYKFLGPHWRGGDVMHYVFANLAWTRFSYAQIPLPDAAIHLLSWTTLVWELGFPLLVMMSLTRKLTLWMGVGFHIGTGIFLVLCAFPFYMICMYLPLVPWERYMDWWLQRCGGDEGGERGEGVRG